jgi:hypothetical protein
MVKSNTNCVAMERGSVRFESIPNTANGVDEFFLEWVVDFGTQSPNDNIDNIGVGVKINAPNMFGDLFARHDFTARTGQMSQKKEFFGRQIKRDAVTGGAMMAGIYFQILNVDLVGLGRRATQERTDTGEQFRKGERFDHVIVRAKLEALNPIADTIAGRQKNDGSADTRLTQFSDQRPAVSLRQHDVDNQKIKITGTGRRQTGDSIARDLHAKPSFAEAFGEKGRRFPFVFDNKNTHCLNV